MLIYEKGLAHRDFDWMCYVHLGICPWGLSLVGIIVMGFCPWDFSFGGTYKKCNEDTVVFN